MSPINTVSDPNLGGDTAADIHLPPGFDETKTYPAIVSTHPIGSCKEQTAGNIYAKGLAEAGFVVLVHDASFQGASGGMPRFIEDPAIRVCDIRCAVNDLQSLPYVDAERIGAIGVCGGGAYTVHAAITDHRIKGQQPHGATSQLMSFSGAATGWDAFLQAEVLLTQPLMVVVGDEPGGFGAYRDGWEIYGSAASTDKHIVGAAGWSHDDLHDKPEPVAIAMTRVVPFLKEKL